MTTTPFSVRGQRVTVVGGGASGRAAAELLVSRGATVTLADTAPEIRDAAALQSRGIHLALGPHEPGAFRDTNLLVVSPGVPLDQPAIAAARAAGVPMIGEIELASRWLNGRVIAITGTKGKSTTTTLAARMFAEAGAPVTAGGNLGPPLSASVTSSRDETIHVVEVSSFQLETTETFHPWIAALLNLSPDHLDRHDSFESYGAAKARIFANQTPADWAVVNADDPAALALARSGRARRWDFSLDAPLSDGVTVERDMIVRRDRGTAAAILPVSSVHLPGRHLLADVLAATAIACLAGVPPVAIQRAVETFSGLEHALERAGDVGGVRFVNDSKATNIASARRSIESVDGHVVAIMGGRFKGGRFEDLRDVVKERTDAVVAIGEATPLIRAAFTGLVPVHEAKTMRDAVRRAFAAARPGGVVVLAPACSSFDMFENYAARGRAFKEEVQILGRETGRQVAG